jgi:hypothetical protein
MSFLFGLLIFFIPRIFVLDFFFFFFLVKFLFHILHYLPFLNSLWIYSGVCVLFEFIEVFNLLIILIIVFLSSEVVSIFRQDRTV